jgi:hypothetical protein
MAGTYTLTVTDANGCTAQASVLVTVVAGGGTGCARGVVISEVAWAGTDDDPEAEWIELRNLLDHDVDLTGWRLRWRLANPQTPAETVWKVLPLEGVVGQAEDHPALALRAGTSDPADEWLDLRDQRRGRDFFLLERVSDETVADVQADLIYDALPPEDRMLDLSDEGEVLELVDPSGCVIDTANRERDGIGGWVGGDEEAAATMERTDPAQGDVEANWHTNLGIVTYGVDADGEDLFGTAGAPNEPLLESGLEETEVTSLLLTTAGVAEGIPAGAQIDGGAPTRTVTLAEDSDLPVAMTYTVSFEQGDVILYPTSIVPPGEYEVWLRLGKAALLLHIEAR